MRMDAMKPLRELEAANVTIHELRVLARRLAKAEMNQDEQGGCVWCGGHMEGNLYARAVPEDHYADCAWRNACEWGLTDDDF